MPPDGCSHDRGHKHPFTVSELFAQEVGQINEMFFTAPPLGSKKTASESPKKEEIKESPEKSGGQPKIGSSSSSEKSDEDDSSSSEDNKPSDNNQQKSEETPVNPPARSLQYELAEDLEIIDGDTPPSTKAEDGEELEITPKFADEPNFTHPEITPEDVVLVEEAKEEDNVLIITDQGEETTSTSPTTLPPQEEDSLPPNKYHLFERLLTFLDT